MCQLGAPTTPSSQTPVRPKPSWGLPNRRREDVSKPRHVLLDSPTQEPPSGSTASESLKQFKDFFPISGFPST